MISTNRLTPMGSGLRGWRCERHDLVSTVAGWKCPKCADAKPLIAKQDGGVLKELPA